VVLQLCQELAQEKPEIFSNVPTYSGVQALADSAVMLRVVAQVDEENRFAAARLINKKMKMGLEKAGMGAPYAQVVVHKAEQK
jgi:small conductance mechanosensitive channel